MPTLECLDERTKNIEKKLEEFQEEQSRCNERFERELVEIRAQLTAIQMVAARDDGRKSVVMWVGGVVIATAGAVSNMVFNWAVGPKGPFH